MRVSLELVDLFRNKQMRDLFNADALDAHADFRIVSLPCDQFVNFDEVQSQGVDLTPRDD